MKIGTNLNLRGVRNVSRRRVRSGFYEVYPTSCLGSRYSDSRIQQCDDALSVVVVVLLSLP